MVILLWSFQLLKVIAIYYIKCVYTITPKAPNQIIVIFTHLKLCLAEIQQHTKKPQLILGDKHLSSYVYNFFLCVALITLSRKKVHFFLKAHTQVKKFRSLKLCYIGLYHRTSIISFSTLHLKSYIPDKCIFLNVHTINNNHLYHNGFYQAAGGLDEGSDGDLIFLRKKQHWGKSLLFCHYTSHEHPMNITCVLWRCSRCKICQLAEFRCVESSCSGKWDPLGKLCKTALSWWHCN